MNRDFDTTTTHGKIQLMQSAESGKPLQRRYRDSGAPCAWHDTPDTGCWDWLNFDYRIKPEPPPTREMWMVIDCEGDIREITKSQVEGNAALALYAGGAFGPYTLVHMREVLP